jgi:hypothetical protein
MKRKIHEYCQGFECQSLLTGYQVLADWNVFWRDLDCEGILRVSLCEKCYNEMKKEFIKIKQKFRSRRIKWKHPFIFR